MQQNERRLSLTSVFKPSSLWLHCIWGFGLALSSGQHGCLAQVYPEKNRKARRAPATRTVLAIKDTRFTLNGRPTFLYGISYYGALGASEDFIGRDLDDMQRYGFNWIRVWATWSGFSNDVSVVDAEGRPRGTFLNKLKGLVGECDRRGMIVDVTFSRGDTAAGSPRLQTAEAHARAVDAVVTALRTSRNWYLDLSNERNITDRRFTSLAELRQLRRKVRELDPQRLVTASDGGDIPLDELREYLQTVKVDFISPHRPRDAQSPGQTETKTKEYLARMKESGRVVPVHYQEPFRRGYGKWNPQAEDFVADLRGALAGGAAGWCFHNGGHSDAPSGLPRRSFDLRRKRLFDQLDDEERKAIELLKSVVGRPVLRSSTAEGGDSVLWRSNPYCSAGFETCCIADFQIGGACDGARSAGFGNPHLVASSPPPRPSGPSLPSLSPFPFRPPQPPQTTKFGGFA